MNEIRVIESNDPKDFENKVNALLKEGFELHGYPQYSKVSLQDEWDGRQRGWTQQSFVQMLKKENCNNVSKSDIEYNNLPKDTRDAVTILASYLKAATVKRN